MPCYTSDLASLQGNHDYDGSAFCSKRVRPEYAWLSLAGCQCMAELKAKDRETQPQGGNVSLMQEEGRIEG